MCTHLQLLLNALPRLLRPHTVVHSTVNHHTITITITITTAITPLRNHIHHWQALHLSQHAVTCIVRRHTHNGSAAEVPQHLQTQTIKPKIRLKDRERVCLT